MKTPHYSNHSKNLIIAIRHYHVFKSYTPKPEEASEQQPASRKDLVKFQEDDTQVWAINCQQRKEPLFSRKSHSNARNRLSLAFVELGGLRRDRAHRVKGLIAP
ncbi:hypothetical protein AVEN_273781-1 [Araneus ventricosus]|uniref:Uncharacterized protein n=1 Tax=Araneus ventricosus TaxID=182803 RepID=A0A4Y2N2W1_ARAVE|nr:hypothetical protein AVEN_273781-1 [Araneus ventricosus]